VEGTVEAAGEAEKARLTSHLARGRGLAIPSRSPPLSPTIAAAIPRVRIALLARVGSSVPLTPALLRTIHQGEENTHHARIVNGRFKTSHLWALQNQPAFIGSGSEQISL
jgi:hypothetical protein